MTRHIGQLLTHLTKQTSQEWKVSLLQHWPHIIGNLSNKVIIEKILTDTVVLGVYDSCWLQELYILSPTLVTLINTHLGKPHIKQVRFKLITRKKIKQYTIQQQKPIAPAYQFSTQELKALEKIHDPVLQEALKRFRIRCQQEPI
jgi:hypothetical protein